MTSSPDMFRFGPDGEIPDPIDFISPEARAAIVQINKERAGGLMPRKMTMIERRAMKELTEAMHDGVALTLARHSGRVFVRTERGE